MGVRRRATPFSPPPTVFLSPTHHASPPLWRPTPSPLGMVVMAAWWGRACIATPMGSWGSVLCHLPVCCPQGDCKENRCHRGTFVPLVLRSPAAATGLVGPLWVYVIATCTSRWPIVIMSTTVLACEAHLGCEALLSAARHLSVPLASSRAHTDSETHHTVLCAAPRRGGGGELESCGAKLERWGEACALPCLARWSEGESAVGRFLRSAVFFSSALETLSASLSSSCGSLYSVPSLQCTVLLLRFAYSL
eukprot:RCo036405